ncbi:S41 family peptidase [Occallatibacter riparius]|uniref:S41 family peptidase n=1 Tax=Occallatibacter riparius TaxID=1002689 RepID=A0A9J7BNF9_9BACT|nr:S41 family peptidase [Occallatibacter riparius]UWZ84049.1 S41 family peptidase [Occallatibacter riparius]
MHRSIRMMFISFVFPALCLGQAPTTAVVTKTDPIAYLNRAIDIMQTQALRRNLVDWPKIRATALTMAAHAENPAGTYDAIRFALASLGDHHSSLHLTPALEALEAQEKAKHPSANPVAISHESFSPYVGRYEPEGHLERRGDRSFGYVVVTRCFPENDRQFVAFESKLQKILAELDQSRPAGWIVDLRGNVGGNMWPMLTGIGPLLGEGDNLGEFTDSAHVSTWRYRDGVAAELDGGKASPYPAVEGAPYHISGTPNVAVLIDRNTGSSGDAIAIAFRGRPNTRFFGEHTQRDSTANQTFELSDGATMWLTVSVQADRTGKQYIDGLSPDEEFPAATRVMPPSSDPVVQAALDWLSRSTEQSMTER